MKTNLPDGTPAAVGLFVRSSCADPFGDVKELVNLAQLPKF